MMPRTVLLGCTAATIVLFFASFSGAAHAVTLAEALSAYRNNQVAEAEHMLGEVAADPVASETDRAAARRKLARIDWMARGQTDAAARALAETPPGEGYCGVMTGALSVFREAGDGGAVIEQADAVGPECSASDLETLRIERARIHMTLAAAASPDQRARHLARASEQLNAIDPVAATTPEVALPRFSLALAQRDAAAAFAGWRTYYWLTDSDAPQALSLYAGRVEQIFANGLRTDAADADVVALIAMLTRAGFADDAQLIAEETGVGARAGDSVEWRRVAAYFALNSAIREATLRANREIINGGRAAWYQGEIIDASTRAMEAMGLSGDPRIALADAFGVYGTVGETSGYPSMHGGHLVQDERLHVEQYGRGGEVRFIVIDNVLANGYESWLWDGWAQAGGWSSDGNTIVQIRSAYTSGPVSALRRTRPGPARERFTTELQRQSAEEFAALGRDGVAELPATSNRLEQQVYDAIALRVGADDDAFIAEVWRATNQYSITSHEGRHALDNANQPGLSATQLEFRAKLSQIIFADYPRLGLASVAGQAINDTPHGRGNRRVLEGYRRWMREHRDDIAGFDASQPTLSQLDKLTDAQIVAAARSMDPWAR
ncbi:MAG TPA: hypothetical protein VEF55_14160 [Candidatus Binatia bacterium]|nr:hypothetical protein [Candidatus Binatia bacterium]